MNNEGHKVAIPDAELAARDRRDAVGSLWGCAFGVLMFTILVAYFAFAVPVTQGSRWLFIGIGAAFVPVFAMGLLKSLRYLKRPA
jgi:hypothetical protein